MISCRTRSENGACKMAEVIEVYWPKIRGKALMEPAALERFGAIPWEEHLKKRDKSKPPPRTRKKPEG